MREQATFRFNNGKETFLYTIFRSGEDVWRVVQKDGDVPPEFYYHGEPNLGRAAISFATAVQGLRENPDHWTEIK